MTRQRRWLRYLPALGVCLLPVGPNVGVTGESPCQHGVWLAGTFAESTPGLSGRAQRSLMERQVSGAANSGSAADAVGRRLHALDTY